MTRLQTELDRLYPPAAEGHTHALVLELARPADWDGLGALWRGVQADLDLPAPAIAVSGTDGLQLWFSLVAAVPLAQAQAVARALVARYLPGVAPPRLRHWPQEAGQALPVVPQRQGELEQWSAFIAHDLAPLFAETPWIDTPPGDEAQARLLSGLVRTGADAWAAACARLLPADGAAGVPTTAAAPGGAASPEVASPPDARRFLLGVMHDPAAPLALRVDAAKALLADDRAQRGGFESVSSTRS